MSTASDRDQFRFGRFLLDPGERSLSEDGKPVALEARALSLLIVLVEQPGRLLGKDALLARIWPGRIVEESNLHVHVSTLRKALGRDAIATVPGSGYRFVAPVERLARGVQGSPDAPAHNLPHAQASFVGREAVLDSLMHAWEEGRLLTLTGLGGAGKTRLAIRLAERLLGGFPHGVRFVDFARVADSARVPWALAAALGVRERPGMDIVQAVLDHLAARRMLLVFDNCEHLLDDCAALAGRLLAGTRDTCLLVTSRERLGIAGERVVPVQPLSVPPSDGDSTADALERFESVRLFVARARQVSPEFRVTPSNAAGVAEICRRLDGIPLSLELAAARTALLSVAQIRASLDDRFRLLTGPARDHPRHQSLLATLHASHDSLAPAERACFRRLSVFEGGFVLEAATAVAGTGSAVESMEPLGRLVDSSLLQVGARAGDDPRFGMLETVREFARQQLDGAGEAAAARDAHLAWCLDFARVAQAQLTSQGHRETLARLDVELPNLLAAHAWCNQAPHGAEAGLDLATNLRTYWLGRGLFAFGHRVYAEALSRPGIEPRGMRRARALYAQGQHYYVQGRLADAIPPTAQALDIAREHGDIEWMVYCLDRLGLAHAWLGDAPRAAACSAEETALAERSGDPRLLGFSLTAAGGVRRAGGDFDAAAQAYEQALVLFESKGDLNNMHNALVDLARVSIARGALVRARDCLSAAIGLVLETASPYRGHFALDACARLAAARGAHALAARFQGASDAAVEGMGGTRTLFDDPVLAELLLLPARSLGAASHARAVAGGRALPIAAALEEAADWLAGMEAARPALVAG